MLHDFGKKLKIARLRTGLTQQEAACRLGLTNGSTISAYESGSSNPHAEILRKLAVLYGVSSDYLLGIENHHSLSTEGLTEGEIAALQKIVEEFKKYK